MYESYEKIERRKWISLEVSIVIVQIISFVLAFLNGLIWV